MLFIHNLGCWSLRVLLDNNRLNQSAGLRKNDYDAVNGIFNSVFLAASIIFKDDF